MLNFIDIDCGPMGNCSAEIIQTRKNFTGVFDAGWKKITKKLNKTNKTDTEITKSLLKLCPENFKYQDNLKNATICLSTFILYKIGLENEYKANIMSTNITNELINSNLFKEMRLNDFKNQIALRLLNETNISTNLADIKMNWTCTIQNCQSILDITYKFFYKISALTSRVTKLGTLLVWSDAYNQAGPYLKTVFDKMSNQTTNVQLDELVLALTAGICKLNCLINFNQGKGFLTSIFVNLFLKLLISVRYKLGPCVWS